MVDVFLLYRCLGMLASAKRRGAEGLNECHLRDSRKLNPCRVAEDVHRN
jgi:hypothetical protein